MFSKKASFFRGLFLEVEKMESGEMEKIESIILKAKVCRLGLVDGNRPYVVPMSFGYHENTLYFHTGKKGRKMEILKRNNRVCFEMEVDLEIVPADNPCKWNMRYRSVVGYGRAVILVDPAEKIKALDVIVKHYGGLLTAYDEKRVKGLAIIKVAIDGMKGKQSKA
jgi:nitroimidazol reductase NimA-like FMN-containing flavoprotein (pyridoxamine 5'-phosphate oxidase superfamily)